jgi:hypothetical protein
MGREEIEMCNEWTLCRNVNILGAPEWKWLDMRIHLLLLKADHFACRNLSNHGRVGRKPIAYAYRVIENTRHNEKLSRLIASQEFTNSKRHKYQRTWWSSLATFTDEQAGWSIIRYRFISKCYLTIEKKNGKHLRTKQQLSTRTYIPKLPEKKER